MAGIAATGALADGALADGGLADGAAGAGVIVIELIGWGEVSRRVGSFRFASHPATSAAMAIHRIIGCSSCEAMIV